MKIFQTPLMSAKSLRYIPSLDGIRGLALIFVMATHYGYVWFGWVWLEFFFVLSGFLITSILLTEKNRRLGNYLGRFYWRRLLRTFPAYFGYLLVCWLVYIFFKQPTGYPDVFPYLATYSYNFHFEFDRRPFMHLWSMSVEEQFYLVWPLLVFILSGANLRRFIIALLVLIPLLRIGFFIYQHLHGAPDFHAAIIFYIATPFQLDAFAAGAAIAIFRLTERQFPARWFFLATGCVLFLGFVNASIGKDPLVSALHFERVRILGGVTMGYPGFIMQNRQFLWGYTVIDFWAAALIICASQPNILRRFFETPFLWYLGRISYGAYIFHYPIQRLFLPILPANQWSLSGFGFFLLLFATNTGVAHLSYFYFERRFLMLKDYFGKRKVGPIAPAITAGTPLHLVDRRPHA